MYPVVLGYVYGAPRPPAQPNGLPKCIRHPEIHYPLVLFCAREGAHAVAKPREHLGVAQYDHQSRSSFVHHFILRQVHALICMQVTIAAAGCK